MSNRKIKKSLVRQINSNDCGIASLLTIIRYHDSDFPLEQLRKLTGTTKSGSTLLGLYNASLKIGFEAEAVIGNIDSLKKLNFPSILHIVNENDLEHFVVCFNYNQKFLIGDPATGIKEVSTRELDNIWKTKACLLLNPTQKLIRKKNYKRKKYKWILDLLKEDIRYLKFIILFSILSACLALALPIFTQKLIDTIIPEKQINKLILGIISLFLLMTSKSIIEVLQSLFIKRQEFSFNSTILNTLFKKILSLPLIFFEHRETGDLIARLNDTQRIQNIIKEIINNTIINFILIIILFTALLIYSWEIALTASLSFPFFLYIALHFSEKLKIQQNNIMQSFGNNEENFINTIQSILAIKFHSREQDFQSDQEKLNNIYQKNIYKLGISNIKISFLLNNFSHIFTVSIIIVSSLLMFYRDFKIGEFVAILGISSSLIPAISNFISILVPLKEAEIAFQRVDEIISEDRESNFGIDLDSISKLELKNLSFRFPGKVEKLFENFNFTISKGEFKVIQGPSGSGKTTFIKILAKINNYEEGKILINNQFELKEIKNSSWRDKISYIPQENYIFSGSVAYNISLKNDEIEREKIENLISSFRFFSEFIENLPNGLDTKIDNDGINISGGQKQILIFIRALIKQPDLLLLDEFTSSMDPTTESEILKIISTLVNKNKIGVIFITHKTEIIKTLAKEIIDFK